jgi:hypothetical protein
MWSALPSVLVGCEDHWAQGKYLTLDEPQTFTANECYKIFSAIGWVNAALSTNVSENDSASIIRADVKNYDLFFCSLFHDVFSVTKTIEH